MTRKVKRKDGKCPDPEVKLKCRDLLCLKQETNNINSIKTTSTMKVKILARRLGSDINDEYHKETIDIWTTKFVVQAVIPNDHSTQEKEQHNQKKELERCNHTNANKED